MNDRYLYRAKRTDNGEWVIGSLVWSDDADKEYKSIIIPVVNSNMFTQDNGNEDLGFENWHKVDSSTICQCTGHKDKNGKLIWENDILLGYLDDSYPEDATYAEVLWWRSGFYTREIGCNDVHEIDSFTEQNYEVIGNKFDNPEILEVGE